MTDLGAFSRMIHAVFTAFCRTSITEICTAGICHPNFRFQVSKSDALRHSAAHCKSNWIHFTIISASLPLNTQPHNNRRSWHISYKVPYKIDITYSFGLFPKSNKRQIISLNKKSRHIAGLCMLFFLAMIFLKHCWRRSS